jgi:hypothetical protein
METRNKTTYKINIYTDVYLDHYTEGQTKHVNYYKSSFTLDHYTPLKAIEESFLKLGFSFNNKFADIHTDDNGQQALYYSHLCDVENIEIEETELLIKEFREGKINLYSNNHTVEVYKLTESNIY